MKSVLFGNIHSYDDLSLILTNKIIGRPEPKTEYVEVLGADGQLDFTESFGEVKYNNRILAFEFSTIESGADWATIYTKVLNELHGQKLKIILEDDPEYYYVGRVNVSEYTSNKRIGKITIEVDAEPYKYKINKTIISSVVNGSLTVDFYNSRKTVVPKFTTTAEVQITFNDNTYTINSSGTFTDTDIIFKKGLNTITFNGNATVTVEYQEGEL